jgi:hypothetical protein
MESRTINRWKADRPKDFYERISDEKSKRDFWLYQKLNNTKKAEIDTLIQLRKQVKEDLDHLEETGIINMESVETYEEKNEPNTYNLEFETDKSKEAEELNDEVDKLNAVIKDYDNTIRSILEKTNTSKEVNRTKKNWMPKPRQDLAIHKFIQFPNNENNRSFLLLHNVGSGKTSTSIMIALNNLSLNFKKITEKSIEETHPFYTEQLSRLSLKENYENFIKSQNRISVVCPTGIYNNYILELMKLPYIEKLSEDDLESIPIDKSENIVTKRTTFRYIGTDIDTQLDVSFENRFIVDEILWKYLYKKL